MTGPVPISEMQAVSACLFASVNDQGMHNKLSVRGFEPSLKLADNEQMFMAYPEGMFWGNAWSTQTSITDGTYWYPNSKAYACYFPWGNGNAQLASDLNQLVGRSCEWDGCGGPVKTSQACLQPGTLDGSTWQAYADPGLTIPVGTTSDPAIMNPPAGPNNSYGNGYQDSLTGAQLVTWRNNQWRQLSVFLGAWADLEVENWRPAGYQCSSTCAPMDGCGCYKNYCNGQGENGGGQPVLCEYPSDCNNCSTVVWDPGPGCGISAPCTPGTNCVRGRKLTQLSCWLRIGFMQPFDLLTNTWVSGTANVHKAGTLVISYANGDPAKQVGSILIRDNVRGTSIDGHGFTPTGGWDTFQRKFIYPVYPDQTTFSGPLPGIDLSINSDPASPLFPYLDYAQIFIGAPYGVPVQEQYDDGLADKTPIPENGPKSYANTFIQVDNSTDFTNVPNFRLRPVVNHPNISELQFVILHGTTQATISGAQLGSDGFSAWLPSFGDETATGSWEIRVYGTAGGGSVGVLTGAVLEMMQKQ